MAATTGGPKKGDRTRARILEVAERDLGDLGYDVATLEGIAAHVGITRSAVLHHFGSKEELLVELVRPVMGELDALLDRVEAAGEFLPRHRRQLFTDLVELVTRHRGVTVMLIRDVTVHPHLGPDLQIADRMARFSALLTQAHRDPLATVRALSALGCLIRPLIAPAEVVDTDDPVVRQMLVESAMAVLRQPLPERKD